MIEGSADRYPQRRGAGRIRRAVVVVGLASGLLIAPTPEAAAAAIIVVNSAADFGIPDDGFCDLREAIVAANTDTASGSANGECVAGSGADTIVLDFDTAGVILSGLLPTIESDVVIEGGGRYVSGSLSTRVLGVSSGVVQINDLDLINGSAPLGACLNVTGTAEVTLSGSTVRGCNAGTGGGGVAASGSGLLRVSSSTITDNSGGTGGGGIHVTGSTELTVAASDIVGNRGRTGGIHFSSSAEFVMTLSEVSNNRGGFNQFGTEIGGVLISTDATAWFDRVVMSLNTTDGATFNGVSAISFDGGGDLEINRSSFIDNVARQGQFPVIQTAVSTSLTIDSSTIGDNQAPALGFSSVGVEARGNAVIENSTVSGNLTGVRGWASLIVRYSTLTANTQGLVLNLDASGSLGGSIVAGNGLSDIQIQPGGTGQSTGYNVVGDAVTGSFFPVATDVANVNDPGLGLLEFNGGPTPTHALEAGSPALDLVSGNVGGAAGEAVVDQRGIDRPQGAHSDAGSYERVVEPIPGMVVLPTPCVVYDSSLASGGLGGAIDGGEIRTVTATGSLPSGQGASGSCVPSGATAGTFLIAATGPERAGNLRLSESGVVPTGGVVNFAANGLDNANTVTIPIPSSGQVDIGGNGGASGLGLPLAGVRVVALAYSVPDSGDLFVPLTPCAVADSRSNQGAAGVFLGPFSDGDGPADVDVVGSFAATQGGGSTTCGVPEAAIAAVVNVVAINPTGGAGRVAVGAVGSTPSEGTPFATLGMNNAAVAVIPLGASGTIDVDVIADTGAATHVRLVVLGYLSSSEGSAFVPVNPCAGFDTRSNQGSTGAFTGLRTGGETTTYQISGALNAAQGGLNGGSCGVPPEATGVLLNLVAINPVGEGNLQVFASGTSPTGGVLNFAGLTPPMNNANAVPVQLSAAGAIDVFVNGGAAGAGSDLTHVRGVVLGYYVDP